MDIVNKNVIANFLSRFWAGILALLLIPVYVRYLGIESYGLMGIFLSLQALLLILDMGLGATINREFARFGQFPEKRTQLRNLLKTTEILYLAGSAFIAVLVLTLAPLITNHWLNSQSLPPDTVKQAIQLIGLILACQWPASLYAGGLSGLQKQVKLSYFTSSFAALKFIGAVAVLHFYQPTIEAFFSWYLIVSLIQTPTLRYVLWRHCKDTEHKAQFSWDSLSSLWHFAGGMIAITIASTVVTQLDKIVLSRLLTLESFGYYSIATAAAGSLYMLISPIFSAFYPKMSELVESKNEEQLHENFHRSSQFLAALLFPIMWAVVFRAHDILSLWLGDVLIASTLSLILIPLVIGNTINGLMNSHYAVQLAAGWTHIPLYTNLAGIALLIPALFVTTEYWGAKGAAISWLGFNCVYLVVTILVMKNRISRQAIRRWFIEDNAPPLLCSLTCIGIAHFIFTDPLNIASLIFIIGTTLILSALSAPHLRQVIVSSLSLIRPFKH